MNKQLNENIDITGVKKGETGKAGDKNHDMYGIYDAKKNISTGRVNAILIVIFISFLTVFPLSGIVLSRGVDEQEENRTLAAFPSLDSADDIPAFPSLFQKWFDDHLAWKMDLVQLKSTLEVEMFHELNSKKVILGTKKPWLFNKSEDGQPMETYKRTNLFTESELSEIAENLSFFKSDLEDAGIRFYLFISPDKEQIYGESFIPSYIKIAKNEGRTRQFIDYLKNVVPDLQIIYPADSIRNFNSAAENYRSITDSGNSNGNISNDGNNNPTYSTYYVSDTHWNEIGAYVGVKELSGKICEDFGISIPESRMNLSFSPGETFRGDLQKMARLGSDYDSLKYEAQGFPFRAPDESIMENNGEIVWEKSSSRLPDAIPLSIYISGDSFRWNLSPYIRDFFSESTISSRFYFDTEDLVMQEPQVFVYMIAERYLQEIAMIPGYNTAALPMP